MGDRAQAEPLYPAPPTYSQPADASGGPTVVYMPAQTVIVKQPKPPNHMFLAVFATICCNFCCGMIGIYCGYQSDQGYNRGDMLEAKDRSDRAKFWSIVSIVCGCLCWIVYIAYAIFYIITVVAVNASD